VGDSTSPSRAHPQQIEDLPLGSISYRFHNLPIAPWAGDQGFNTWPLRDTYRTHNIPEEQVLKVGTEQGFCFSYDKSGAQRKM
jgi:hypothetical protein